MKKHILFTASVLLVLSSPVLAQQAGDNINVLPLFPNAQTLDEFYTLGDGYLQRQLEPTIAASTRNPDHLLSFFNDYRAVEMSDDPGLGESQNVAMAYNVTRVLFAMNFQWPRLPYIPRQLPTAAAEAWVGMSRSYDGGLTWSGGFLPGAQFDASTASLASPVYGLEAATDPVLYAGPCGKFYVVFVAFTRGGQSKIAVARYEDLNNFPGGDTIVYLGTTILETGNNSDNGHFLDKPDLKVDVLRPQGIDQCSQRVYVTYSTFTGLSKDGKIQSKVNFAMSEDYGVSYTVQKINKNFKQNQGSAIAIDPGQGTPNNQGGPGTVYVAWRHFFDPDAIVVTKSTDYGSNWDNPTVLTTGTSMAAFDQPTISTTKVAELTALGYTGWEDATTGLPEVAFRSNGFPTAAVTANGEVYVAWQERVDISTGTGYGLPYQFGSPRIVMMRSDDSGKNWSDIAGNSGQRRAVDMEPRDLVAGSAPDDTLPQPRLSGPQVMPKLSFGNGRLMLAYYESRGRIADYGTATEHIASPQSTGIGDLDLDTTTGYISGYDRLLDFRAALLDPATGTLLNPGSTIQVSRYPLRPGADLSDGAQLNDVAPVNPPCSPDYGSGYPPCVRQVHRAGSPTSAAGTSPFIGDYPDLTPFVQFVPDGEGGWRWATQPGDAPTRGFHTVWADNRHLIPPQSTSSGWNEWEHFDEYAPPFQEETSCINPGSRNTDVLTSRIDAELVISAPSTYKAIGAFEASFPFSISNRSGTTRTYSLTISPEGAGSFMPYQPDINPVSVPIFPYSSTSQVVYLADDGSGPFSDPVTVSVVETDCDPAECQVGTITFNADDSMASTEDPPLAVEEQFLPVVAENAFVINPTVDNAFVINSGAENAFVINSSTENAFVINPTAPNAFVINPSPFNAFVINAFVINAFVINPTVDNAFVINTTPKEVIDTTWTVSPGDSTAASTFLPVINIDNAEQYLDNYAFQLIVHKDAAYGTSGECAPANVSQPQILSSMIQPAGVDPENAFVINPTPKNAFVINDGFPGDAFVINSAFTMAPSDAQPGTKSLKSGHQSNDGTLKAPRAPDTVFVTLRAYRVNDLGPNDPVYNPYPPGHENNPNGKTGDRASLTIIAANCDTSDPLATCYASNAPDLVPEDLDSQYNYDIDPSNVVPLFEIDANDEFEFPAGGWTLKNQGNTIANAENGNLRHGVFLCDQDAVHTAFNAKIPIKPSLNCSLLPLDVWRGDAPFFDPNPDTVAAGDSVSFPTGFNINIPKSAVPSGQSSVVKYLVLVADHPLEVSEIDEVNNEIAIPITILVQNEVPTIGSVTPPSLAIAEDATVVTGVIVATDPDGDELTYTISVDGNLGNAEIDGDGNFTYVPTENEFGSDSFTISVSDGEDSIEVVVPVVISSVNDAPVADDVTVTTDEEIAITFVLRGTDIDGDTLTFLVVSEPTKGTLSGVEPNLTYTPNTDSNDPDSLTYVANDGTVDSAPATVSITVNPVNDEPVADDQSVSTDEDTALDIVLTGTDVDNDPLTYGIGTGPSHGTLSGTAPNLTYTPAADYHGPDSFTFTVDDPTADPVEGTIDITVVPVNDAPTASDTLRADLDEDTTTSITLTGSDIDGDSLTYRVVSGPTSGTVSQTGDIVTYTPTANFHGTDSITFVANDGAVDSDPASVDITVASVNDAPAADNAGATTDEDTPVAITLNGSDVDGDSLTFVVVAGPSSGTLSGSGQNLTYTPNLNFNGSDNFTFAANDGAADSAEATVTITVDAANDPPTADDVASVTDEDTPVSIALTGGDIDGDSLTYSVAVGPTNGALSGAAPNLTYTPNANFNGSDSFTYGANDGTAGSASATVSITVHPVNDVPTAVSNAAATDEDVSVGVTLAGADIDGDFLTFSVVAGPANGSLSGTAPSLSYTPDADYNGPDSFTFVANDGTVDSAAATISINVAPANDAPVAGDDVVTVLENSGITSIEPAVLLTGDTDIDGLTLSVTGAAAAADGVCTTAGTVSFDLLTQTTSYTPPLNFESADCFVYSIADGAGGTDVGLVTVIVDGQVPDWTFVGFAKPWRNNYRINAGSGFPLKWYYEDRVTETVADSSLADPVIHIFGPLASCSDPIGTDTPEVIEDTGSSDLRHNNGEWQFNWDTVGLGLGCYKIQVESQYTLQLDGPYTVILK